LETTPEGNILVAGVAEEETRETQYWLLDGSGKTLAGIRVPAGIGISKNFVFIYERDDEGNEEVRCLRRKGDEKTDLLRAAQVAASPAR
jgi:hypothetical protein